MIEYSEGSVRFNYRVAGVCIREGCILLHRGELYDFWALPGGRPELLEYSTDALVREMQEETGLRVRVGRLLWIVENFYHHDSQRFHELALYYEMTLPEHAIENDVRLDFRGFEGEIAIVFRWFPVDQLHDVPLFPAFLKSALSDPPGHPVHLIITESAST